MSDSSSSTRGASGPGTVDIVKHSEAPVPGFLEEVFRERGYRTRVVDRASGDGLPRDGDKGVGTLVLGGPMGVYEEEDFPFLREERRYLRDLVRRGEPVLCICLGAQLLATALGGKAYPGGATEVGWHRLQLTEPGRDDPLLKPFVGVDRVLQWHGDTFDLPDGAVHLASSPTFENQAFRVGRRAYGIQFHPEIEESTVRGWIDFYRRHPEHGRDPDDVESLLQETGTLLDDYQDRSREMFRAFTRLLDDGAASSDLPIET